MSFPGSDLLELNPAFILGAAAGAYLIVRGLYSHRFSVALLLAAALLFSFQVTPAGKAAVSEASEQVTLHDKTACLWAHVQAGAPIQTARPEQCQRHGAGLS